MAKKTTNPTTFDSVLNEVYGSSEETNSVSDMDAQNEFTDVVVEEKEPTVNKPVEDDNADDVNPSDNDDDSVIPQNVLDKMNGNPEQPSVEDNTDESAEDDKTPSSEDLAEAQQVGLLFDAIGQ